MGGEQVKFRDTEEFESSWSQISGVDTQVLQLSPGAIDFSLRTLELDELSLIWTKAEGRTRWRDQFSGEHLHLGILIAREGKALFNGQALDTGDAVVWMPGETMEYVFEGPYQALEIDVASSLQDRLGWENRGQSLNRIPADLLQPLIQACLAASKAMDSLDADEFKHSLSTYWRDEILERLEPALQPWLSEPEDETQVTGTRHHQLVTRADEYFAQHGYDSDTSVDELAEAIGVPRRTIFHAYRKVLGVGPRRYLELVRLHQLRARLKQAPPGENVTSLAMESGFHNLGRLSALYHGQFGEYPSETLKQAR